MNKTTFLRWCGVVVAVHTFGVLVLAIWVPFFSSVRIIAGSSALLVFPGLAWSYVFLPTLHPLERIAITPVLSLAIVPLVAYILNFAGIPITTLTLVLEVAAVVCAGTVVWMWREHPAVLRGTTAFFRRSARAQR